MEFFSDATPGLNKNTLETFGVGQGVGPDIGHGAAHGVGHSVNNHSAGVGSLLFTLDGVDYAIPDPEGLDSATFTNEEGMTIVSDLDGDGRVDYVSTVSFDGHWAAWRPGGSGGSDDSPTTENGGNFMVGRGGVLKNEEENTAGTGATDGTTPDASPEIHNETWSIDRWKCVDRGGWG